MNNTENTRLLAALLLARDAMRERRGYANHWEYKYGPAWDAEDDAVDAALDPGPAARGERPLFAEIP